MEHRFRNLQQLFCIVSVFQKCIRIYIFIKKYTPHTSLHIKCTLFYCLPPHYAKHIYVWRKPHLEYKRGSLVIKNEEKCFLVIFEPKWKAVLLYKVKLWKWKVMIFAAENLSTSRLSFVTRNLRIIWCPLTQGHWILY